MIIELMLDRFFEGAKNGQTKFSFYAADFGCSEEYLQENIGKHLNSCPYKKKAISKSQNHLPDYSGRH